MPCFHPLTGYYARKVNETGKRSIVFNCDQALVDVPVQVPCGRCIGCRLDRSRSWAVRCVHEASLYDHNCFVTLTIDDKKPPGCSTCRRPRCLDRNVSPLSSLRVCDFQNFMKRLRKFISPRLVRFFHCGEYGAQFSRPHHHACLFGYDFPDKVLFKRSGRGSIYTSEILSSLWPYGFSTVGPVTFDTAAYVARYVLKKWSKENLQGQDLYAAMEGISNEDAKARFYQGRHVEYVTMSRAPGIGSFWYDQFKNDIFPCGFVVLPGGKKAPTPKFYDNRFELDNYEGYAKLKGERTLRAQEDPNNSPARLSVREEIKVINSERLIRGYEYGY